VFGPADNQADQGLTPPPIRRLGVSVTFGLVAEQSLHLITTSTVVGSSSSRYPRRRGVDASVTRQAVEVAVSSWLDRRRCGEFDNAGPARQQ
jgi:hypothetical protein